MLLYPASFTPAKEGGFVVRILDIPGAITEGDSFEKAMEMAQAVIEDVLHIYIQEKRDIPPPGKKRGRHCHLVPVPAMVSAKLELYIALRVSGMRKAELGRRMGIPSPNVERLFDLHHQSRIDQLEKAFSVLGKRLCVFVEEEQAPAQKAAPAKTPRQTTAVVA